MVAQRLAGLDGSSVVVEVPASSANLGAGYDCLGVAIDMTNRIEVEVRVWSRGEIELTVDGEGRNELTENRENRFVRGLEAALLMAFGELPQEMGWRIGMRNQIPLSRGLGSSAAATVGGVLAGNALAGEPLSTSDLLRLATQIEDHPDNAASRRRPVPAWRRSASMRRVICAQFCSSRSFGCRPERCERRSPPRCRSPTRWPT
jgi:homoserine kinase